MDQISVICPFLFQWKKEFHSVEGHGDEFHFWGTNPLNESESTIIVNNTECHLIRVT